MRNCQRFHTLDASEFSWKLKRQKMIQFESKIDPLMTTKLKQNDDLGAADFMIFVPEKKDRSCLLRPPENKPLSSELTLNTKLKANLIRISDSMELRNWATIKINIQDNNSYTLL